MNIYMCIFHLLLGGLTAVIYTDTLQTVILLIGSTVLAILGEDLTLKTGKY